MSDPFHEAAEHLCRAMAAAKDSVLEHLALRGLAVDRIERPNDAPTADRPIIFRGKSGERHAAIWLDINEDAITVRVDLPQRVDVVETTLGFSLADGLNVKVSR